MIRKTRKKKKCIIYRTLPAYGTYCFSFIFNPLQRKRRPGHFRRTRNSTSTILFVLKCKTFVFLRYRISYSETFKFRARLPESILFSFRFALFVTGSQFAYYKSSYKYFVRSFRNDFVNSFKRVL